MRNGGVQIMLPRPVFKFERTQKGMLGQKSKRVTGLRIWGLVRRLGNLGVVYFNRPPWVTAKVFLSLFSHPVCLPAG